MDSKSKDSASSFDRNDDGVRTIEHGNRGSRSPLLYKALALMLVLCAVVYLAKIAISTVSSQKNDAGFNPLASSVSDLGESSANEENAGYSASASTAATPANRQSIAGTLPSSSDRNDIANYIAPGQTPRMEEVIDRLHAAGIHEGLGAFSPPGTSPPMIGLAVPDDYVLPEGYVRHFQATDDGQRIEPILMYSPDYVFYDSSGHPIAIPDNRVVPGNMAPPGLAIRPIKIPLPREPGGP